MPKPDFQSQFSVSKINEIFLIFFLVYEYQFRSIFFVEDIFWYNFWDALFSKMMPNFWQLLVSMSIYNNFFEGIDFWQKMYLSLKTRQPVLP